MKKLILYLLVILFHSANTYAQSIVPNNGMQGQSLQTTITLAAGAMYSSSGPMGSSDIYLQQGATTIFANSAYSPYSDWYFGYDSWGNYVYTDSGRVIFDIPLNAPSGLYDVVVYTYLNPWGTPTQNVIPGAFFIGVVAGTIRGSVYFDTNQNGVRDLNEPPMANSTVQFTPGNQIAFTNSQGEFIFFADTGTYTTSYIPPPTFSQTSTPLTYTSTIPPSVTGQDFGTFSSSYAYDHNISIIRNRVRCNLNASLPVQVYNSGLLPSQDRITLITSSNYIYVSSTVAPDIINGDTLTWNTPVINPGTFYHLGGNITFTAPGALQLVSITVIDSVFDLSGNFVEVYTDTYTYEVRCSYDPNDKHVSPQGVLSQKYTPINSALTYLVNFQNTGNDSAYDVFIFDTLDVNLDPLSFELLGSSHEVNTQLTPNGDVRFNFFNIMLPDSGTDEPGSHGWVLFKVNPDASLPDPTVITNTAHIVFDQNSPIITNTTLNTMTALQYPQSGFSTADVNICETSCIIYNNLSTSGTSYNWSFPGGSPSSSTASAPGAICYSTSGSYDVTLITTNALGSDTLIQPAYINVAVSPAIFSVVQSGDSLIAPQGYSGYEWYFNNVLIPGDTLYYHIATQNGDYGVVVSNPNGCQSGVNISNVTIGIYETVDSKLVTLYPNPTSDRVEISYNSMTNDIAFISIIDKIGQVVKSVEYKSATGSNKFELNTSELSSGIYTIQISIGSKLISKMLMINK